MIDFNNLSDEDKAFLASKLIERELEIERAKEQARKIAEQKALQIQRELEAKQKALDEIERKKQAQIDYYKNWLEDVRENYEYQVEMEEKNNYDYSDDYKSHNLTSTIYRDVVRQDTRYDSYYNEHAVDRNYVIAFDDWIDELVENGWLGQRVKITVELLPPEGYEDE